MRDLATSVLDREGAIAVDVAGGASTGEFGAGWIPLRRRVAEVCARLADLLGRLPTGADGPLGSAIHLLDELAAAEGTAVIKSPRTDDGLARLVQAYGLAPVEIDLLVLAGLADEHEGLAGLFRLLHPRGEPRPTLGLAAQLLCRTPGERPLLLRALLQGAALRSGILRLTGPDYPLYERSIEAADTLWVVLSGLDVWPDVAGMRPGPAVVAGLEDWLSTRLARRAMAAVAANRPWTILVTADHEDVALERAVALAQRSGRPWTRLCPAVVTLDVERLLAVHAVARGVVPVVTVGAGPDASVGLGSAAIGTSLLTAAGGSVSFAHLPGPVLVASRLGTLASTGGRPLIHLPIDELSPRSRRRMWAELLPELEPQTVQLAARHVVEPALAARTADDLRDLGQLEGRAATADDVAGSLRARAAIAVSGGVRVIRPSVRWPDLVLPEARLAQLREAVARLEQQYRVLDEWGFLPGRRGARGVRMLFAGPPGTGKTLAAELLAGELGVELLVVDTARVVSKWIGETEKNLAEVFDMAERAKGALLFDEADALFGKRTDVADAHDRYANLETAYLLGRIERFEGLVILSTNLRANIDPAFTRRLEAIVTFDEPDLGERIALWRAHVPAEAPVADDVDFDELAAFFPVVGGVIRNAAVGAAFLAAGDGGQITRRHMVMAIRREYEKQGRAFPALPDLAIELGGI